MPELADIQLQDDKVQIIGNLQVPNGNVRIEAGRLELRSIIEIDNKEIWTSSLRVSDGLVITRKMDFSKPLPSAIKRIVTGRLRVPSGGENVSRNSDNIPWGVNVGVNDDNLQPINSTEFDRQALGEVEDVADVYKLPKNGEAKVEINVGDLLIQLLDEIIDLRKQVSVIKNKLNIG